MSVQDGPQETPKFKTGDIDMELNYLTLRINATIMRTLTVDILKDEGLNLLRELETLNIIRLHPDGEELNVKRVNFVEKYKGTMSKQSSEEIDQQLNDMRNEWD